MSTSEPARPVATSVRLTSPSDRRCFPFVSVVVVERSCRDREQPPSVDEEREERTAKTGDHSPPPSQYNARDAVTGIWSGPVAPRSRPHPAVLHLTGGTREHPSIPPSRSLPLFLSLSASLTPSYARALGGSHLVRDQGGGGRLFVAAVDAPSASVRLG